MSRGRGQHSGPVGGVAMTRWQRVVFHWRLRRFLKRKAATPRAVARSSGLMEWSDRELARLKPSWTRRFIRRQRLLARLFEMLTLTTLVVATLFFALSLERFWVWESAAQTALHEEKRTITKWQAWHAVKSRPPSAPARAAGTPAPRPLPPARTAPARSR